MTMTPLQNCLEAMVAIFEGLQDEKDKADVACEEAYAGLSKTLKVGDDDPPSLKTLKKIAKAKAADKMSALTEETNALRRAIIQVNESGEQRLPGMDSE